MCVCVHACVHACVCACVCVCVRACPSAKECKRVRNGTHVGAGGKKVFLFLGFIGTRAARNNKNRCKIGGFYACHIFIGEDTSEIDKCILCNRPPGGLCRREWTKTWKMQAGAGQHIVRAGQDLAGAGRSGTETSVLHSLARLATAQR